MNKYILAIDQGTTGSTAIILDQSGNLLAKSNFEFPQIFPKPGWVEHNPEDIWSSVQKAVEKTIELSKIQKSQIAAIGITNQRETTVLWDRKTGQAVYNAIVWQCRRTQNDCEKLKKLGHSNMIQRKTGLVVDPYFSATKIKWILSTQKEVKKRAQKGELAFGTIDSFLLYRLTNGKSHKTDVSNASRTMLMNIHKLQWDKDLLKLFSIPEKILPSIESSSGLFGYTAGLTFLPDGIPISGIAGDQQSALFGQTCFDQGDVKCTFGTGSFILLNTGKKAINSKHKMLTTIAWQLPNEKAVYALEGGAFICGAAVQWLRDGLKLFSHSSEVEKLALEVSSSEGVEFVPALTGLGAPYWDAEARGLITGLTRGATKAHIARATLEAMALQNCDILNSMQKDLGSKIKSIKVDGGAVANNLLMQLQTDYLGIKVQRPEYIETTAIGAAFLAGLGVGYWKSLAELKKIWKLNQEFKSQMTLKSRQNRLENWHQAIKRTLSL